MVVLLTLLHPVLLPFSGVFGCHSSQRHFYLAVDRLQFKMETLVDLLGMAGRLPCLPMVVCCNSRDELDAISYALSNLSYLSATPLYSDLAEADRALILEKFRQATIKWNRNDVLQSEDKNDTENEEQKSRVVVATDACLPLISSGEAPVSARVLINYELPSKKNLHAGNVYEADGNLFGSRWHCD
ncbi:ATP-dependent RNA helicase eIF4A isoform X2 [Apium graveolens]|uniref:ATP-dependent RNA helicase eIF4A isoform X2 n=1 Tax=Apium graveolens TaxID=4045 RepID=UPI003D7AD217